MRVGTVPQGSPLNRSSKLPGLEITRSVFLSEVSADSVVILCRHLESLERECTSQRLSDIPLAVLPSLEEAIIIGGIGKDGDPFVILGCSTKKGNTPNINLLDCVCESASRFRDCFGERIEVANHDRDGRNRLSLEILFV